MAAATAPAIVAAPGDPFADLFGLGGGGTSQPSKPPPAPVAPAAASGPMRPRPAAQSAGVDLLSGWDDFEALFAAGATPAAQQPSVGAAPGGAVEGTGAFEVSFPPPPPMAVPAAAAAPAPARSSSPPKAAVGGLKKTGSVSELAPAAAKKAVGEGLAAFQLGKWDSASSAFGKALDKGAKAGDPAFTQAALPLFVAARLLAAATKKPPAVAARLARFATALPLAEEHKVAAVALAVDTNMAASNFGWAWWRGSWWG